ncbi:hypothetical protein [Paraburkholderia adhaesiva]|uniref:hypothetical protein n=1 Tax=Paraburkholderia adhaesiva TaxID=2883244 RepID=UPI001F1B02D9|nr:hypothetical protein [Paraburkholderia adhaesiva]
MLLTVFRRACGLSLSPVGRRLYAFSCARRASGVRAAALALRLCVAAGVLAACSPTYDWRTVSNDASGYSVDLPAKPRSDQRDVEIAGTPMHMRMQTAEVNDVLFVVGTVALPDARSETQQQALAFLRDGLARNVGVAPDARDVAVPVATGGAIGGIEMRLTGKAGEKGETRTIHARLVAKGTRVYEVAIVGRAEPSVEQVDQFFRSFRLH